LLYPFLFISKKWTCAAALFKALKVTSHLMAPEFSEISDDQTQADFGTV
jgi:hypothetical protein